MSWLKNKKSFCIKCLKEVSNETEKCECGGGYFAFGDLKARIEYLKQFEPKTPEIMKQGN